MASLPVFMGYEAMGIAFGVLIATRVPGFHAGWTALMSLFTVSGSMQFAAVDMLRNAAQYSLWTTALLALLINIRYCVYGLPFLGVWRQYIGFAREEPELYRLLCLTKPVGAAGGAAEALRASGELVRPSLMRIYNMDADTADKFFRDLWLVAFSFATLVVTDDCPYSDEEMSAVMTEVSLSVCKAYKEVPGLKEGDYDRDAIFRELVRK